MAQLTFLGAARTVTGSKYLVDDGGSRVLVDCGLFQGMKELRLRNWKPFPVPPASIDAVVLTHAHLDHVGYLPRLVAEGFAGPVYCTSGTKELCSIVLPDSGRIQEEDARQANRHQYTRHAPALPLYDERAAYDALTRLHPVAYDADLEVVPGISVRFENAGHLLGSSSIQMRLASGRTILFGGDLGRYGRPVLPDPDNARAADIVLCESTYGDRDHPADDGGEALAEAIRDTADRRGKLIIPAFAIGRVEDVLYWIRQLERKARIPALPVYVDSPMASRALSYYATRFAELDPDMKPAAHEVSAFATARFQAVSSPQQSKELTASRRSAIVISSSGMATGGRVLHHLAAALPDARNTVLFVGYQAAGTRGRALVEGAAAVRIHGQMVNVKASILRNDTMSAHADRGEIVRWLRTLPAPPQRLCLVHGEPQPMDALKARIAEQLGWDAQTPQHRETIEI
jgi:metallo-beta-lactamase family protein